MVSLVSSVTVVMRLPISCVSSIAISCHTPTVSTALYYHADDDYYYNNYYYSYTGKMNT